MLLGIPLQFVLLDLGHIDVRFDPKNEILRVYAYLGEERTPVKEWLAACLWHNLCHNLHGVSNRLRVLGVIDIWIWLNAPAKRVSAYANGWIPFLERRDQELQKPGHQTKPNFYNH